MSAPITHCSNAHQILEAIILRIFQYETGRHRQCIDEIGREGGIYSGSFLFRAKTYRMSNSQSGSGIRRMALPEHVWDKMDLLTKDIERVEEDSRQIWQILFSAIFPCTSLQDVRNVLPDFVVEKIPELATFPRTEPEMFTVQDDRRLMRQYANIREKIELYHKLATNPQLAKLMTFYNFEV
jgi:hypothetical protein